MMRILLTLLFLVVATLIKIYSKYNVPDSSGLVCVDDKAQQHFKDECDINNIIDKYRVNGCFQPSDLASSEPVYADVSDVQDFASAQNFVIQAQEQFMSLDSKIRRRFNDDPVQFMAFCEDACNYDEAISLGICVPKSVDNSVDNSVNKEDISQE